MNKYDDPNAVDRYNKDQKENGPKITTSHRLSGISQVIASRLDEAGYLPQVFEPAVECAHDIYRSGRSAHMAITEGMTYAKELNDRLAINLDKLRAEGL